MTDIFKFKSDLQATGANWYAFMDWAKQRTQKPLEDITYAEAMQLFLTAQKEAIENGKEDKGRSC